jgi:hypothetical protein
VTFAATYAAHSVLDVHCWYGLHAFALGSFGSVASPFSDKSPPPEKLKHWQGIGGAFVQGIDQQDVDAQLGSQRRTAPRSILSAHQAGGPLGQT